jgi:hypothetical protein
VAGTAEQKDCGDEEHHLRPVVCCSGDNGRACICGRTKRGSRAHLPPAYPTPRIGTMNGVATAQREFFRNCVAKMREEDGN